MFDEEQAETDSERLDRLEALVIDQFWTTTIMQDLLLAIWTMIFDTDAVEKLKAVREILYAEAGKPEWLEKYKDMLPGKTPEETANYMIQNAFKAINKMIAIVTPE